MLIGRLSYNINWQNFKPGMTFFVPCLNCMQAKQDIAQITKRLKIPVLMKVSIEDGIRGIRVWRV